jgi:hypothetical protein
MRLFLGILGVSEPRFFFNTDLDLKAADIRALARYLSLA